MINFYVTQKKSSFMNFKFLIMIICAHPFRPYIFMFIDIFINFLFISKTLQRYEGFIWCCDVLKCIHHLVNIRRNMKKKGFRTYLSSCFEVINYAVNLNLKRKFLEKEVCHWHGKNYVHKAWRVDRREKIEVIFHGGMEK